ncbi:hypothetical protein [Limnobacter alexandrii]|uniref:hypothetical protein n=1 Tax=Limnobacter alexandrii TaxID=2570352 RepID=UPI001107B9C7|nr:hypothetical protein [Limnobacter alexandrii]
MRTLLLSFLLALVGCSNGIPTANDYLWLDPEVREKVQNSSEELLISRPPVEFSDGISASNCEEYFQRQGEVSETAENYSARSHYLICDALKLAATWPPKLEDKPIEEDLSLCSTLSLSSFVHSLRPRIEADGATLTQLFGEEAIEGVNTCSFQGEGRNFVLNAVLLVQEKERPKRMWVWVIDEILDATYRAYTPVWFMFDESRSMWIADY